MHLNIRLATKTDLDTSATTNTEGNTIVVNDAHSSVQNVMLKESVTHNLFEVQDHNLVESLEREVIVGNGVWNNGNNIPMGTTMTEEQMRGLFKQPRLYTATFPDKIINESPFISSKLANVAYMTADIEFTFKVQATPFAQGALWIFQAPYSERTSQTRRVLNEHLRSLTAFPGVELNLSDEDRSATLTLPYVSEFQVINPRKVNEIASVSVAVLLPLETGESAVKATYTALAKFKNIRLYGHSPRELGSYSPGQILAQSGREKIWTQSGEDQSATKKGIISSVANTVADVSAGAGQLGIPAVTAIAKPIEWVARAAAGVASLFGFSRPHYLEPTHTYSNVPGRAYTNTTGLDNSVVLGVSADNAIDSTKTTFDSKDEMAIEYLAQRPYVFDRFTWSVNNSAGDLIGTIPMSPCNFVSHGISTTKRKVIFAPPIGAAASLFKWWRGRPNIRLAFAKTQFQQGRLKIQYLPYGNSPSPTEEVLSWIVDLTKIQPSEGFTFDVPLVTQNKWLQTYDSREAGYDTQAVGGVVVISVLTPLISADTVSNRITMAVWMKWNDFEVNELGTSTKVAIFADDADRPDHYFTVEDVTSDVPIKLLGETRLTVCTLRGHGQPPGEISVPFKVYDGPDEQTANVVFEYLVENNSTTGKGAIGVVRNTIIPAGSYVFKLSDESFKDRIYYFFDNIVEHPLAKEKAFWIQSNSTTQFENPGDFGMQVFIRGEVRGSDAVLTWSDPSYGWATMKVGETYMNTENPGELITAADPITVIRTGFTEFPADIGTTLPNLIYTQSGKEYIRSDQSCLDTTMGERVVSLRNVIRRATLSHQINSSSIRLPGLGIGDMTSTIQSVLDIVSYFYRFSAGGVRYKIITEGQTITHLDSADRRADSKQPLVVKSLLSNAPSHFQNCDLNNVIEVEQPFYSPAENLVMGSKTFDDLNHSLSYIRVCGIGKTGKRDFTVLKAAGDDMSFSFLVGAPAIFVGPA